MRGIAWGRVPALARVAFYMESRALQIRVKPIIEVRFDARGEFFVGPGRTGSWTRAPRQNLC